MTSSVALIEPQLETRSGRRMMASTTAMAAASRHGPEYDRLRATLRQLHVDAKDGLGATGAQLAHLSLCAACDSPAGHAQ